MIGPSPGMAPGKARRYVRPATRGRGARPIDAGIDPAAIDRPITSDEVDKIASQGYPLQESIEVMQLRNRRITLAYSDLSERLAHLVAGDDGRLEANWCTFATWSSRTVGTWIEDDAVPEPLSQMRQLPRFVVRWLLALVRWLLQRAHGASYRALAAGNRFVFLEIGSAVALFLEHFDEVVRDGPDETHWTTYWSCIQDRLGELAQLDLSWMSTDAPEPADLRLGLRQYYEALFTSDPDQRAERVLAGTMLVGAYEQRRLDGYVSASLAAFPNRAMRNLVCNHSGRLEGWRRWPSSLYARIMTRGLVLNTVDEQLKISRPLPPLGGARDAPLFPPDLATVTLPLAQALLTRYDLSGGNPRRCRARDWTSYDQRMNYITSLFRSRQQHAPLFTAPFPPEAEQALLAGHLPEPVAPRRRRFEFRALAPSEEGTTA